MSLILIGIYSDAHFSKNGSAIESRPDVRYSVKLDYLVKSFKWMYELFKSSGVQMIINCGDLVSNNILDSETSSALSEALSYNSEIPEYHILGNHERKSLDHKFNSIGLIKNYDNMYVIDKLTVVETDDLDIVMVPFLGGEDEISSVSSSIAYNQNKNYILCTHQNYVGMLPFDNLDGFNTDFLFKDLYLKKIFNGHIHNACENGNYVQVGSISGNSFGDNYSSHYPGVIIYNTDDNSIVRYENPYSMNYHSINGDYLNEVIDSLKEILGNGKLNCVRIDTSIDLKEDLNNYIKEEKNNLFINIYGIRIRTVSSKVPKSSNSFNESFSISRGNIYDKIIYFISSEGESSNLPYSLNDMITYVNSFIRSRCS